MACKFGGCGPSGDVVSRTNSSSSSTASRRVVRALEGDRRGHLHVHAGTAAQRAAEMAGPDLALAGQREQLLAQRAEDALRALGLVDGQVGARDVADEQRVAGQHRPRLRPARGVDQREGRVLGPVAGRVQGAHDDAPELELPAVVEGLVLVVGVGEPVDVDRGAGRVREAAVAGHVVGVVVGLEDVLDPHAHVAREREVLLDVELRVDDRGDARVLVTDEVRGAAEVVVGDLAEDHRRPFTRVRSGRRGAGGRAASAATTPSGRAAAASREPAAAGRARRPAGPRCRGSRPSPSAAAGRRARR